MLTNFVVKPRNINEEELRKAVMEIDALFAEKNCLEAISVSRMLLATLKASPDESNWNKLRNGGCGAFFRATKACMNDLQTRLYSGNFFDRELCREVLKVCFIFAEYWL